MIKILLAFILGIIFAAAIITIVLTRHKAGTLFYDQSGFLLGLKDQEQYKKIIKQKYVVCTVEQFSVPQETDATYSEDKNE